MKHKFVDLSVGAGKNIYFFFLRFIKLLHPIVSAFGICLESIQLHQWNDAALLMVYLGDIIFIFSNIPHPLALFSGKRGDFISG